MKPMLIATACTTFLSAIPAFSQSVPYFGKSDAPVEDVRTIRQLPGRVPEQPATQQPDPAKVEASTRLLIQDQYSGRSESSSLPLNVHPAEQDTRRVGNKWATSYRLSIGNIPLSEASNISSLTTGDGATAIVRERNVPRSLNFNTEQAARPTISVEKAESAALYDLEQLARINSSADISGLVLRKSQLEIWVDPRQRVGKLAWALDLAREATASAPVAAYRIWVDALATSEPAGVFEVKNLVMGEHRATVMAPVWDPTPNDPFQLRPLPKATVQVQNAEAAMSESGPAKEITNEDGTFDLAGLEQKTLMVSLQNQFFRVRNALGATATVTGVATNASSPLTLQFGSGGEYDIAQPSAFYWANRVRAFVGDALRATDLVNVELQVNTDDDCNAKFSSIFNRVMLYRASLPGSGKSCINKAYRDTVFHEYGHAIDHALGGIASPNEAHAYSEGFGDSLAILFKNNSCYGANHQGPQTCLRDASTPPVMFDTPGLGVHERGRVYAGFTWELIQALKQQHPEAAALAMAKELTLGAAAQNPVGVQNAVELVLQADDDDLDLSNGTPNSAAIKIAANARGIPLPPQLP